MCVCLCDGGLSGSSTWSNGAAAASSAVYALANRTVNASAIEECAYIFWAATVAVKDLASIVEPLEAAKSPTFAEHYIDLPLGGVDDSAWRACLVASPPALRCTACACSGRVGRVHVAPLGPVALPGAARCAAPGPPPPGRC